MEWYLKVLRQYADFTGRARRKEFWMFTLVSVIISLVLALIDSQLPLGILGAIYALAVVLPSLAVGARRLHDTGRTGWWQLLSLIPIIGTIVLIVFWATDGDPEPNAHGPNPKESAGQTVLP